MSASLVGSEMCIRDSSLVRQAELDLDPMVADTPTGEFQRAERIRARARPVSYTHLTLPTICSV
eukprot:11178942-Alexandrium_andersonii.AAC.1